MFWVVTLSPSTGSPLGPAAAGVNSAKGPADIRRCRVILSEAKGLALQNERRFVAEFTLSEAEGLPSVIREALLDSN
jgi:hypothetical protein